MKIFKTMKKGLYVATSHPFAQGVYKTCFWKQRDMIIKWVLLKVVVVLVERHRGGVLH